VDFWGKTAATIQSAEASLAASRFDRDTVALTLTANVASTWFQALALGDRVAVARRTRSPARPGTGGTLATTSDLAIGSRSAAQHRGADRGAIASWNNGRWSALHPYRLAAVKLV
jgi:hypothetical protein